MNKRAASLLVVLLAVSAVQQSHAQPAPYLVSDIATGTVPQSSDPTPLVKVNGALLFTAASSAVEGRGLWRTDGTAQGTTPLEVGGDAAELASLGSVAVFRRSDAATGSELWRTDGTAEGTALLKDISPGVASSTPRYLTVGNGIVFFSTIDGLWRTDGTAGGTVKLSDAGAALSSIAVVNGVAFFLERQSLWRSDGTSGGTTKVHEFPPPASGAAPVLGGLRSCMGLAFFNAPATSNTNAPALWRTDGVSTVEIAANTYSGFACASTQLFFQTSSGLWRTDGYTTSQVRPMFVATGGIVLNGTYVFAGRDATASESKLWKTDGTSAGTVMVKDVSPTGGFSLLNGIIYFAAAGPSLWRSDGTEGGTYRITDLPSAPAFLGAHDGRLYFSAADSRGRELWRTDGSAAGTTFVANVHPDAASSDPVGFVDVGDITYFAAMSSVSKRYELWRTDGSAGGTTRVSDVNVRPDSLTALNGVLLFNGNGTDLGIWRSDGTAAGTTRVSTQWMREIGKVVNSSLFFTECDAATGCELWKTDGTTAGTMLVRDVNPGAASSEPRSFTVHAGRLYFSASAAGGREELWVSDGSHAGTTLLKDMGPGYAGSSLRSSVVSNGVLYFGANSVHPLWKTDGTTAGTVPVTGATPAGRTSVQAAAALAALGDAIFFEADRQFWRYSAASGLQLVKNIWVRGSFNVGDLLYLAVNVDHNGDRVQLWRSNGTTGGTVLLGDFRGLDFAAPPLEPNRPIEVGGIVYFLARTADGRAKLWMTDGTPAGTRPLPSSPDVFVSTNEVITGVTGTAGRPMTLRRDRLLLNGYTAQHGAELWAVRLRPTPASFSGGNTSDLLWRHSGSGTLALWELRGRTLVNGAAFASVTDLNWKVQALADFGGDGKTDVLWRHMTTGQVAMWEMNGRSITDGAAVLTVADLTWQIQAVGDVHGDGRAEIFWRNSSTGAVAMWEMNGHTLLDGSIIVHVPDHQWQIVTAGDFNGDSRSELLWRHTVTGDLAMWELDGRRLTNGAVFASVTDLRWRIEAVGDFNGDGTTDLLWRHASSGTVAMWEMRGRTMLNGEAVLTVESQDWRIETAGDYDGDGRSDVIWRNGSTGTVAMWQFSGHALADGAAFQTVSDLDWTIQPRGLRPSADKNSRSGMAPSGQSFRSPTPSARPQFEWSSESRIWPGAADRGSDEPVMWLGPERPQRTPEK